MKYLRAFLPAILLLVALAACASPTPNPTAPAPAQSDQAMPEATQHAEASQPTAVDQARHAPAALHRRNS